jgi:hypothetical protein
MIELNLAEQLIIQKWRSLPEWGYLEIVKQNGVLFEVKSTTVDRPKVVKVSITNG